MRCIHSSKEGLLYIGREDWLLTQLVVRACHSKSCKRIFLLLSIHLLPCNLLHHHPPIQQTKFCTITENLLPTIFQQNVPYLFTIPMFVKIKEGNSITLAHCLT